MFRTELPLTPHPQQLPHSARVLTIGSCFSDSIGNRLADFKVATLVNPFGTVFNPVSACKLLRAAAGEDMDWQQHVVEARGRWQSYDLHATLGAESPVDLLQHIQSIVRETGVFLATADAVVLTLGTAYAYRLRETEEIISNCHKVPADKFEKELLTADEIIAAIAETHAYLRRINPRLRFILTVSPVRHLKETLPLSSVSKSMLRVACHFLSELLPDVSYFPAYELLMDDLRDYRFYASDMLHPSDVAENYIWERFTRTYFDTAFGRFKKEWEGIRQALAHRPLHSAASEHRQFLEGTLARLQRLSAQADVRMELLHVERELASLPLPPPPPTPEPDEDEDEDDFLEEDQPQEADQARAELLSQGSGLLIEAETSDEQQAAEADPDEAYESAYSGATLEYAQEEEPGEEADGSISEAETPVRKKKRRSRGGAKRSKRKAARLAAEAEAALAVTAVDTPVGQSDIESGAETATSSEDAPIADGITYITEAELFGKTDRPSAPEAIKSSSEELLPVAEDPSVVADAPETAEPTEQPSRRRNRPQRKGRQQDREPRRGNRQALYAVPPAEEAEASIETEQPTVETQPLAAEVAPMTVPEVSETGTPEAVAPEEAPIPNASKGRSRSRGGAGRNRGKAAQNRVAAAAESAATAAQPTPPSAETPVETVAPAASAPLEPSEAPVVPPPSLPKRAPRKPSAAPAPTAVTPPVEENSSETSSPPTAPPAKKRAARKTASTVAPEPTPTLTTSAAESAPKPSRSRKKAAPEPTPTPEGATAPAPKRARPPRRKPAPDQGTEASE
ncbi:GSCFA domain-containing protein [Hymenobacter fodinae]|uniref:GSCFA domain-containing protein n=1 Tax=Hymenobacter fodinae TaxID=2510796 RepID=A0A4Z0PDR0_9BACT|nr:GSCFA domain-containing protein [Hymenobacter fodinae]TGE10398.1 hypothetical protein EU556_06165 [Hymenobacter fodinae]